MKNEFGSVADQKRVFHPMIYGKKTRACVQSVINEKKNEKKPDPGPALFCRR